MVCDLSRYHNWWASSCAGTAVMLQNMPDGELLDAAAEPQILDACLGLCSAWLCWPSLFCCPPLLLLSFLAAAKRCLCDLCAPAMARVRGTPEIGSAQGFFESQDGGRVAAFEKVKEAAAERVEPVGAAGVRGPPGERGLSPDESAFAQGRIRRESHLPSLELLCPKILLVPSAKGSWCVRVGDIVIFYNYYY